MRSQHNDLGVVAERCGVTARTQTEGRDSEKMASPDLAAM